MTLLHPEAPSDDAHGRSTRVDADVSAGGGGGGGGRRGGGRGGRGGAPVHHDDDRLDRNATALVVSSVITSLVGFGFWVLAARTLSEEAVGLGAGLVAAVVLLGQASTLGLRNALPRFLPEAGISSGRLIARSYAAVAGTGVLLGVAFVIGLQWWGGELAVVRTGWLSTIGFVAAVAVWAVFVLQDSVLIGLRHAPWVPVENLIYAVAKLALLLVIARETSWVVLTAWVVPAALILGPLNIGIYRRLLPTEPRSAAPALYDWNAPRPLPWRRIVRFAGGDHCADIVRYLGAEGVVLIVLARLGPAESAPLFFAITIAVTLQLLASNVMSAFVAEAAARPERADELLRRSAARVALLVVPTALVAIIGAPIGLRFFGAGYADSATEVLRILLLASIPQAVIAVAIGWLRYRQRVSTVLAIAVASAIGPIIGAAFLAPSHGIVAVGWATLIGNGAIAAVLLLTVLRPLVLGAASDVLLTTAVNARASVRHGRRKRAAATLFDELDVSRAGRQPLLPREVIPTETDVVVARVAGEANPLVVKVALSAAADDGLIAHADAVTAMRSAVAHASTRSLLPEVVETGTVMGQRYVIETACAGERRTVVNDATLASAAAAFSALHRVTARPLRNGDQLGYHVVHVPSLVLRDSPRLATHRETVVRLADVLERALIRYPVMTARTHGDCWLGNVLFDPNAPTPIVSGVIDWENSVERGLPEVDLAHLWLAAHPDGMTSATLRSLTVDRFVDLAGPCATDAINTDLPAGLVVLLAWMAHVADGLSRSSRFGLGNVWLNRNVTPVLQAVNDGHLDRLIV